jgi:hypothetical protein
MYSQELIMHSWSAVLLAIADKDLVEGELKGPFCPKGACLANPPHVHTLCAWDAQTGEPLSELRQNILGDSAGVLIGDEAFMACRRFPVGLDALEALGLSRGI